jgi:hypothetical protein
MVALGACGSPSFECMDGLPQSLGACGCALGHTDGLAHSITARLPGVVAQRVHAAAGTCIIDEHKANHLTYCPPFQHAAPAACVFTMGLECVVRRACAKGCPPQGLLGSADHCYVLRVHLARWLGRRHHHLLIHPHASSNGGSVLRCLYCVALT